MQVMAVAKWWRERLVGNGVRGALRAGLAVCALAAGAVAAQAQTGPGGVAPRPVDPVTKRPVLLQDVRFDQKLDAQVPADLSFKDDLGNTVRLGDYFG